jgi:transposase
MGKEVVKVNPGRKRVRFTKEFKLEAVRLLELGRKPATELAMELDVQRNQLYKWQEALRGKGEANAFRGPGAKPLSEYTEVERLRRELKRVTEERDILKNRPRGLPRPLCIETGGVYTGRTPGQWPFAFWRHMSPSKNLAQGKLRTQLWWHCT